MRGVIAVVAMMSLFCISAELIIDSIIENIY